MTDMGVGVGVGWFFGVGFEVVVVVIGGGSSMNEWLRTRTNHPFYFFDTYLLQQLFSRSTTTKVFATATAMVKGKN